MICKPDTVSENQISSDFRHLLYSKCVKTGFVKNPDFCVVGFHKMLHQANCLNKSFVTRYFVSENQTFKNQTVFVV